MPRSWKDYLDTCEQIDPSSNIKAHFREIPKVSVVGCFQNGKSTFINCLLDEVIARPGNGLSMTKISTRYQWGERTSINLRLSNGDLEPISLSTYMQVAHVSDVSYTNAFQVEIALCKTILKNICLIDTPGFNADEADTTNAIRSLDEANYAIVVLTNEHTIGQPELAMLKCISEKYINYTIIMNCRGTNNKSRWFPSHSQNQRIIEENEAILNMYGHRPEKITSNNIIFPCNFLWYWLSTDMYAVSKELTPDYADIEEDLEWVFIKKGIPLSKEILVKESGLLPIKAFLENRLSCI